MDTDIKTRLVLFTKLTTKKDSCEITKALCCLGKGAMTLMQNKITLEFKFDLMLNEFNAN